MTYRPGDHLVICDQCGFKKHRSQTRMMWNNLLVCADTCWEPKHPLLDLPPLIPDNQTVANARPEPTDAYVAQVEEGAIVGTDGNPLIGTDGNSILGTA
ncbi:MAG: hypothetical protein GY845_30380 [Planctomycetes bacterium]|nr:hypothetical protein [Planctomycetota bacterium]